MHGGVGIFVPFFGASLWLVLGWSGSFPVAAGPLGIPLPFALLAGALSMFVLGLLDDIYRFRPATKLVCQLLASNAFILAGGVFAVTGFLPADLLVTYFWFIGIINAVNMLDNMDGLASGVAIIALGSTAFLAHEISADGTPEIAFYLGLVLVASTLGFWAFNRPPASIFMGDSGALFLGYVLAALTMPSSLNGSWGVEGGRLGFAPVMTLVIPVALLAVPIFDTTLVTITRQLRAQAPTVGGQDHSSHRLVGLGLSERGAVWMLYLLAAGGGAIALLIPRSPQLSLPLFGLYAVLLVLMGVYLARVSIQTTEPGSRPAFWTPLVSQLLHKARAAEVVLDLILIVLSFQAAYLLRFDGWLDPRARQALVFAYPFVVSSYIAAFFVMRIYRERWKFITVADLPAYGSAVLLGTAITVSALTLADRFGPGHSRSAHLIHAILLFSALAASRLSFRIFDSLTHRLTIASKRIHRTPVLIYGAGSGGKFLRDEIMYNDLYAEFVVVGFIDDDRDLWGRQLSGLPVQSLGAWLDGTQAARQPEIWISTTKIDDAKAQQSFRALGVDARARRLRISLTDLDPATRVVSTGPTAAAER